MLCVGFVVLVLAWFALAMVAGSWESFYTSYRPPRIALGLKFGFSALASFALAIGVALGHRWARWLSIVVAVLLLCFSVLMFWDGYLRIKPLYSGEESSEVFGSLIFSVTSLCVLVAMFIPAARGYFEPTRAGNSGNGDTSTTSHSGN
jgi:TRAP-type C4-dicarboxylate transport system permease small subunit